jgi:hypothetical protein
VPSAKAAVPNRGSLSHTPGHKVSSVGDDEDEDDNDDETEEEVDGDNNADKDEDEKDMSHRQDLTVDGSGPGYPRRSYGRSVARSRAPPSSCSVVLPTWGWGAWAGWAAPWQHSRRQGPQSGGRGASRAR